MIVAGITFLVGLLVGDYAAGQLNSTVFGLSALAAALVPIAGTVAQIYSDRSRAEEATRVAKREIHAQRIVDECLLPLCRVEFFGRDGELWMAGASFLPLAVDSGSDGGRRYIEGLRFWKYAREHLHNGSGIKSAWEELEKLGRRWNQEKYELDRMFLAKAKELVRQELGEGFAISPDWIDPPPLKWFNVGRLADWTRRGLLDFALQGSTIDYAATPTRTKLSRFVMQSGPYTFFGAETAGVLPEAKCKAVYSRLLSDRELLTALAGLRATESQIQGYLPGFIDAAWDFCQGVEGSLSLPGTCEICNKYAR